MKQHALRLAAAVLLAASCAPQKLPPVDVVVLVYNPATRAYEPRTVQLNTPTNITTLQGPVAKLVGGAKFALSDSTSGNTVEELAKAITKDAGHDVNVSYIETQQTLVPADFHSLNMVTTYYNFERAYQFFTGTVGGTLNAERFGVPNVYYFAGYEENGTALKDNAMFIKLTGGFLILPFEELQQVPLAINLGVVGHEYAHSVFNYHVHKSHPLPPTLSSWRGNLGATPGANLVAALDEGSADIFGWGITCSSDLTTCDAEYIGESLPAEYLASRRVDQAQCMDEGMWINLEEHDYDDFTTRCVPFGCHYTVGSVFASALWRAASDAEVVKTLGQGPARRAMFEALWNAQSGAGGSAALKSWGTMMESAASNQLDFSLRAHTTDRLVPSVLDAVIDGATDDKLKIALCSAFMDRFGLTRSDFARCPATAASYNECPR